MLKPGRMKEILEEISKARVDVVAVQEIRWQGQGRIDKKDFSLFHSGPKESTSRYRKGFIINAKMKKSFLSFEPLSDRLCKLRLRGEFRNISLISTFVPTEDSPGAKMDEFYDQLSQECEKARKYDILILLGDFNAKIGREHFIVTVAGKYTLHEVTSENGKRLGQLAAGNNMIIKSTCFEHKAIHKGTWMCLGTDVVNQIDHVIIKKRHASSITDVRSCRGPSCDSDHFLAKVTLRERLSNALKNQGRKRWNIDKLKN
jgi:endonuclease/exonuclease/phosphatase family metal-dependent hydrolase